MSAESERFQRVKLGLPLWAISHVPFDLKSEVTRVSIWCHGVADEVIGKQGGKSITHRDLFEHNFGTELKPLP